MAEADAALPWAVQTSDVKDVDAVQDTDAATTVAEEDLQPVSIQQLGLEPGARIEVMWEVTVDAGDPSGRWFAASISCSTSAQEPQATTSAPAAAGDTAATPTGGPPSTSAPGGKQPHQQLRYTLKYDGSEEFPEETATVLLLSEHVLYDTEKHDSMFWRLQGDSFEPPEDSEDDDEVLQASDMECSAEEAAEVEAALMERLSSATQSEEHRAKVVAGYNDFKEQFKAFIAAKAACADGGDVLITTSDVEEFKAIMNTQRATAAAHRR